MDYPPEYIMKKRHALIINIVNYKKGDDNDPDPKGKREGSEHDEGALVDTLETLGYTVKVEPNLNGAEIIPKIQEHAQNCDSFICCILAHGTEGKIIGSDGVTVEIDNISLALEEIKSLKGKPKMIFIQACRGRSTSTSAQNQTDTKKPLNRDFFYGYATTPGMKARRFKYGSYYINNLCDVVERRYKHEDLLTMMTRVQKIVADVTQGSLDHQQHPQLVSSLRMAVNF